MDNIAVQNEITDDEEMLDDFFEPFSKDELFVWKNKQKKCGAFNKDLNIEIPFEYEYIYDNKIKIHDQKYLTAAKNGNIGIINTKTKEFHKLGKEDEIKIYDDVYIKQSNNKYGIANLLGEYIIPPQYDKILYWQRGNRYLENYEGLGFYDARFLLVNEKDGKTEVGIADTKKVLKNPCFDFVFIEEEPPEELYIPNFKYPAFIAFKDNKAGLIDENGNTIIDFKYDDINSNLISKIAEAYLDDKVIFVNIETKKEIFSYKCDDIQNVYKYELSQHFVILTKDDNKYKVIDEKGNILAQFENSEKFKDCDIYYCNNEYLVCKRREKIFDECYNYDKSALIDYNGNFITDFNYTGSEGIRLIEGTQNFLAETLEADKTKYKIIDNKGNVVFDDNMACIVPYISKPYKTVSYPIEYWHDINDMYLTESNLWYPEGKTEPLYEKEYPKDINETEFDETIIGKPKDLKLNFGNKTYYIRVEKEKITVFNEDYSVYKEKEIE